MFCRTDHSVFRLDKNYTATSSVIVPSIISTSLSRHCFNASLRRKALWLALRDYTTLLKPASFFFFFCCCHAPFQMTIDNEYGGKSCNQKGFQKVSFLTLSQTNRLKGPIQILYKQFFFPQAQLNCSQTMFLQEKKWEGGKGRNH